MCTDATEYGGRSSPLSYREPLYLGEVGLAWRYSRLYGLSRVIPT